MKCRQHRPLVAGGEFGGVVGTGVRVVEVLFGESPGGVGGVGGVPEARLAADFEADVADGLLVGDRYSAFSLLSFPARSPNSLSTDIPNKAIATLNPSCRLGEAIAEPHIVLKRD